jgi:uncharacterized protein (TIGR02231 family)
MRRRPTTIHAARTIVVAICVAGAAPARADKADKIDSVVVFPDRARVTHVATARCERATARAVFERLPVALDARTLRGEVREQADLIGVASDVVNHRQSVDLPLPRARGLTADLRKVQADVRAKEARRIVIAGELEDLAAYATVFSATTAEEMRNPRPVTAAWGKALDGLADRRAALDAERRKLDVALRGLRLEENKLSRQLRGLGAGDSRASRTATVTVGCRALAEVTTSISYVVPGATWQPEYDLDFSPRARAGKVGPGTARLTVGAVVRQTTGEDWRGVRLSLSTARPKLGSEAPKPAPLLVDGHENKRGKVLVEAQERREQIAGGAGAGAAGPRGAALDDKGNAFVITLPHRVTVMADGRPVWAPVDVVEGQASAKLVTTPKLDEHVYQVVALKNPAAYPLLEGRLRSYRAGSYVGDAHMRYRGVGEPIEVSLGIDDEIKVERKTLDDKSKDPSLLSSTKHLLRATRVILTNRAAGAETVELRENIPVSQIDDVKVEIAGKQTTTGYSLDGARGFVTWPVALKSGEEKAVDLGFVIHLPDAWQVGPR